MYAILNQLCLHALYLDQSFVSGNVIYATPRCAGVAVLSVMLVTTCLVSLVMLIVWETPLLLVLPFALFFLVLEGVYFSANIIKACPTNVPESCSRAAC